MDDLYIYIDDSRFWLGVLICSAPRLFTSVGSGPSPTGAIAAVAFALRLLLAALCSAPPGQGCTTFALDLLYRG